MLTPVINGGYSAEDGRRVVYAGADGRDATGRLMATLNRAIAAVATLFEDATPLRRRHSLDRQLMPSRVDPNHPATGIPVSKAASRANWAAARFELEHGGFFTQAGTGALERQTQGKLRECVSATDFGALGDNSGTTVAQWLTGGKHSRGAADLTALRAMTGIADLRLTDTIDWAAITAALKAAEPRAVLLRANGMYRTSRPIVIDQGGLVGEYGGTLPTIATRGGGGAFDAIQIRPAVPNRVVVLRRLVAFGSLRGIHANSGAVTEGTYLNRTSVFEDIGVTGQQEGFFFENLAVIGVTFKNINAETCGGDGIRFTGPGQLNASQLINCRAVFNQGDGFRIQNTHDQAANPAVTILGCTAEWNYGAGMRFLGTHAALYSPYFEGNDNGQGGAVTELMLGSNNRANTLISRVAAIAPYFGPNRHPQQHRISRSGASGTQYLSLIQPYFSSTGDVIDASNIILDIVGLVPGKVQILGYNGFMPSVLGYGVALSNAQFATTSATSIGIPATAPNGSVLKIMASRLASAGGAAVAEYLLRRNEDGTVTSTFVAGTDFLTFGVDGAGIITVASTSGTAGYTVSGF
jgi:hypothetical protein